MMTAAIVVIVVTRTIFAVTAVEGAVVEQDILSDKVMDRCHLEKDKDDVDA